MKGEGHTVGCGPAPQHSARAVGWLVIVLLTCGTIQAQTEWPRVVPSRDGVAISYEVRGEGEPTLVCVHGWSCNARY